MPVSSSPVHGRALTTPFFIDDLESLREKLARGERDGTRLGQVWAAVRRRAQAAPERFPWFVPFTALVTDRMEDKLAACEMVRRYVATFEPQSFGMGLQFHFWCFAFPHARWSLYFQWLDALGAWEPAEAQAIREELITFQFLNFFYGMRTKPEPMCLDNQTMSLCFSNALLGYLFGGPPADSSMAARMFADGHRRLPAMLGGMPQSGYSGEGSTYMDYVVGPSVPFIVELLERADGGAWFSRPLEPSGGSAEAIIRMIAREWMPNGLMLPWDHYGYALPVRSTIAYGAHKTGDPLYFDLLDRYANWGHEVSIGWGYDDLVWTLVWWPDARPAAHGRVFPCWAQAEVGGALVSEDADLYLMQMWDPSTPKVPGRGHVNPNALVLCAGGSPLTTDGVTAKDCTAFNYDDTWREVRYMTFTPHRFNFGSGCAGAHGVLLVDGWEGMRAGASYPQAELVDFDAEEKSLTADVTPIYHERWSDARQVRRRSRLCGERFWLIEDLAEFAEEHAVTARWYLRPQEIPASRGVAIETAEGMRLRLLPLLGPDEKAARVLEGYPDRLDGASVVADFTQRGAVCRWLWLAWPEVTREVAADIADGWQAVANGEEELDFQQALDVVRASSLLLPLTLPAFMLADLPVARRWWYRRTVTATSGTWWLRLPQQMGDPRLWVNGEEIDLAPHRQRMELLPPQVAMPAGLTGEVEIVLRIDCGISQYGQRDHGGAGFCGQPAILAPSKIAPLEEAEYRNGTVTVRSGGQSWQVAHELMPVRG